MKDVGGFAGWETGEKKMDDINVRPLGHRLIVRLDEKPKQVGEIILPDFAYVSTETMATVLRVSPGWDTKNGIVPLEVKEGDRICVIRLHEKNDTQERIQESLGEGVLILSEEDVLYVQRGKDCVPLRDKILVKPDEPVSTTPGGIIIPEDAKEKQMQGTVVAVGTGHLSRKTGMITPLEVKPGDRVLFGKYSGTDFKVDNVEHLIVREDDIYGVLEG